MELNQLSQKNKLKTLTAKLNNQNGLEKFSKQQDKSIEKDDA